MSNDAKHALGDAPNSEFLVDPEGKVVVSRRWSRPDELRAELEKLVGKVENPTTIADLGMKPLAPPKTAAKGIVPRLQVPGRMTPVKVEVARGTGLPALTVPGSTVIGEPLYVKLRAELDSAYASEGTGQLYLGFFLDPLYKVHWNNEVAPVAYAIEAPEGVEITPARGDGPQVDEKADADPREFLLEVSGESDKPIKVTVKYFACDDAETFCKPVTQQYLVTLERDRDGGSRRSSGRRPGGLAGGPRPGFGDMPPGSPPRERTAADERRSKMLKQAIAVFRDHDINKDGKLDTDELAALDKAPSDSDVNDDGFVSLRELVDALARAPARTSPLIDRSAAGNVLLSVIDINGDGALTKEELAQASVSLSKLDRNKDGEVSADELNSAARPTANRTDRPNNRGGRPSPAEMFARMDRNRDGKITKDPWVGGEFEARIAGPEIRRALYLFVVACLLQAVIVALIASFILAP